MFSPFLMKQTWLSSIIHMKFPAKNYIAFPDFLANNNTWRMDRTRVGKRKRKKGGRSIGRKDEYGYKREGGEKEYIHCFININKC